MIINFVMQLAQDNQYADLSEVFSIVVGFFAILLLIISLRAYRRTRMKRMLLVSSAFGLFAVKTFAYHLDIFIPDIESQGIEFILTALDLLILLLFFLAVVRRD